MTENNGYLCFPNPGLGPNPRSQFVFDGPGLSGVRDNKSQRLPIMLLSLFLLRISFVKVIVYRSETKNNLSKKRTNKET